VKLDRFSLFDLARKHRLSATQSYVLLTMTMHASFRTAEWFGSITELAESARISRTTATKVVGRLVDLGLVEVPEPFGPNQKGTLRVLCYDLLVTDALPDLREELTERRDLSRPSSPSTRAGLASDSRQIRADVRDSPARTGDREVERQRGGETVRDNRTLDKTDDERVLTAVVSPGDRMVSGDLEGDGSFFTFEDEGAMCAHPGCSEPIVGHSFNDHEPATPNEDWKWPDGSDLTDGARCLFQSEHEDLGDLLAEENGLEMVGMTEAEVIASLRRAFPGIELVAA
jgi:hypothetical protein